MPYRSAKQRRFMHAKHPAIAKRWDAEYGSSLAGKLERKVAKKRRPK
jgi:hypothetical protein